MRLHSTTKEVELRQAIYFFLLRFRFTPNTHSLGIKVYLVVVVVTVVAEPAADVVVVAVVVR